MGGKKLNMKYTNEWSESVQNSGKCFFYKHFKENLELEKYVITLPIALKYNSVKFRMYNHRLPIELGRHMNIDKRDRICNLCNSADIGDEFHYFCICPAFHESRKKLFKNIDGNTSVKQFCVLLSTQSISIC